MSLLCCVFIQNIDLMGIHLLRFTNIAAKHIWIQDVVRNAFAKEPFSTLFTRELLEKTGLG
jgi:hypothetical protein